MSARSAMASAGAGRRRRGYRQLPRQCTPPVYPLLQMLRYPHGLSRGAVWLPDRPDFLAVSAAHLSYGYPGVEIYSPAFSKPFISYIIFPSVFFSSFPLFCSSFSFIFIFRFSPFLLFLSLFLFFFF